MKQFFVLFLILFGFSAIAADPKAAYKEFSEGKAIIIDVRELDEVKEGMVKGAQWIALSKMQKDPEATVKEVQKAAGEKTIYAYCRSGKRSQVFLDKLKEFNIEGKNLGGFNDLVKAGLPTEVGQE